MRLGEARWTRGVGVIACRRVADGVVHCVSSIACVCNAWPLGHPQP